MKYEKTAVGDKYVYENMVQEQLCLLEESSQDILFSANMQQQVMES